MDSKKKLQIKYYAPKVYWKNLDFSSFCNIIISHD